MADILLIQPPIRDFYLTEKRTIPYGLTCIAAELMENGFTVEIMDALAIGKSRKIALPPEMNYLKTFYGKIDISPFGLFHAFKHFGYSYAHIGKTARDSGAFLVGISSLFTAYSDEALETARTVKAFHPRCRIVMGGHHPTILPETVMAENAVDFVIRGEGEAAMTLLAAALRDGREVSAVPGIVFRKPDRTLAVSPPAELEDLDVHPLPALGLIRHAYYRRDHKGAAVVMTSRGCPMNCTYCAVGGGTIRYRVRSRARVIREIETAVNHYGARFIDFEDENLSLDHDGFLALLDEITRRFQGLDLELRAMNGLFAPTLDATTIRAMKLAGFRTLNISLGTTALEQLQRFRRPDVRKATEAAITAAREQGLGIVCYIIVGAPDQSAQDSLRDLLYLASLDVLAGVSVYYPAPGSVDYARLANDDLLPERFSLMRSTAIPLSLKTTRRESVTLLRLGRILGFMRLLLNSGEHLPPVKPFQKSDLDPHGSRNVLGSTLLSAFFHDGRIRGMTPDGEIFEHNISPELALSFRDGLKNIFDFQNLQY